MIPSNFITGKQAIELVKSDQITLAQVIQDHQARYLEPGALFNAWVSVNHEDCIQGAAAAEAVSPAKPLTGMIVGVKDIIDTKDMPTEHGSPFYKGSRPGVDAAVVAILRDAGATLIGKTTTHEFAYGTPPGTLNPFDAERGSGGSSVGSAVAVCDYQCHVAIGSQTTGSLIRPSSNNGVFGFKPTWGLICLDGVKTLAPTFDTIGFQARAIHDIELVCQSFKVITSIETRTPSIKCVKIGFVQTDLFDSSSTPDMVSAWKEAKRLFTAAGVEVSDVDLGPEYQGLSGVGGQAAFAARAEIGVNLLANVQVGGDKVGALSREPVQEMENVFEVLAVLDKLASLRPKIDLIAKQFDALITPSSPGEPGLAGIPADHAYVAMWTGLHVPMINLPGLASAGGLPIGLSLIGPRYGDQKLLQVAKAISNVLIAAGQDRMIKIPAPEGTIHLQP